MGQTPLKPRVNTLTLAGILLLFSLWTRYAPHWKAAFLFCSLLMLFNSAPARAQPKVSQKQLDTEWQAGEKALAEDRFGAALAHFNRVLEELQRPGLSVEDAMLAVAFHNRADAFNGLENWPAALADYSKVLELSPRNADAYAARAIARKTAGDYDGLIADAQKAASLDAEYAGFLDDARSTVLYRRVLLGFLVLGGLLLALGAIPFCKSLAKLVKAG